MAPILFLQLNLHSLVVYGEELVAASDIWAPFFMGSDGSFTGVGVDVLTEVVRRTGDTITFKHLPNMRAQVWFDEEKIDMMVIDSPLWNEPEKFNSMVFSNDIMSLQEYIYFLRESYIEVKTPDDLRGKSVNTLRGYIYPIFEEAFKSGILKKNEVDSELALIKTLVFKRASAIFMDSIAFDNNISKLNYPKRVFKKGLQLSNTQLAIKIIRKKSYLFPRINKAISLMKLDGTIDRIKDKYIQ